MNINKPKRLIEFITIPQCILALLLTLAFIHADMYPDMGLAIIFAFEFLVNVAIVVYYILSKNKEETEVKALYAFLASFLIVFSCGIFMVSNRFSSTSIMSPETIFLLCSSVSMIYLSAAIIKQTRPAENPAVVIALCAASPVAIYLLLASSYTLGDASLVTAIGLVCVFLFLLGKLAFILYIKYKKPKTAENNTVGYSKKYLVLVAITSVLLPQIGLAVNRFFLGGGGGLLGDFSNVWYHIIAVLNGLLLLIDINKTKYKLPLLYLKTAGFAFISYFTLIFIPYMPYAVIGIILYGLGLLVYIPAVVFVVQIKQLSRDFKLLKNIYPKQIIVAAAVTGFLALPSILAVNFSIDRANFANAMAYVNPGRSSQREVDFSRLNRSLTQIEASMISAQERGGLTLMPGGTPIISTAYRFIALDNLFFTEDTLLKLRKIFTPETAVSVSETMWTEPEPNRNFSTKLSISGNGYDPGSGAYKAWVDFEITQLNSIWLEEYRTKFTLPDGCFITDYYLYVGNEKKRGIITDKRAAQVAYESIIRTPKDPGIVYYDNDDTIALRVYPFSGLETRKTGFQIMYSQNETLEIEGQVVDLTAENPISAPILMDGVQFVPMGYKKTLPVMERQPLYYFLLDAGDAHLYQKHIDAARLYAETQNIPARYYAVSYQAKEVTDPTAAEVMVQTKGGFNTAYAMNDIYSSVPNGSFPIILLVTENMNRAVPLEKTRITADFPESGYYYRLNDGFSLTPYRFSDSERLRDVNEPIVARALNNNGTAVSSENNETVITGSEFAGYTGNQYQDAFILQKNTFLANTNASQISYIKESMTSRILTKNTAFIVMETIEQEEMLLSLQEKFLSGKSVETPSVMMSEPGWAAVIIMLGLLIFCSLKEGVLYRF